MSPRLIASISTVAIVLFGSGAVTASATLVLAGLTTALVAALLISIKTDDPTRPMSELLLEEPEPAPALVENRVRV